MAVKSIQLACDYCYSEESVSFDAIEDLEDEFLTVNPKPAHWYRLEGNGEEKDYCSQECLRADL
jgi:hypothetical protein